MPANPNKRSYLLIGGPYHPPRVSVGDEIQCEIRGKTVVVSWSDRGKIMWPRCKSSGSKPALALTGDLVRACQTESEMAVAAHWSVSLLTVQKWRRALGVGQTAGTAALVSERQSELRSGTPVPQATRDALLRAAKRPKSADWVEQLRQRNAGNRYLGKWNKRQWRLGKGTLRCPCCGLFLPSDIELRDHPCLQRARLIGQHPHLELHVPGHAEPFVFCTQCVQFRPPTEFTVRRTICTACTRVRRAAQKK